ncbi:MAG: hypothetical protein ACOY35_11525 [Bacillota bacterium]
MGKDDIFLTLSNIFKPLFPDKCPPHPEPKDSIDLCVPVVFAKEREKFFDINVISLSPRFCPCQCQDVEITDKNILFDCDKAVLFVEYTFVLWFSAKFNESSCKTFKASFKKEIPFHKFVGFPEQKPITTEEFQRADSTCLDVDFLKCLCFDFPSPCGSFKNTFIFVVFDILIKLLEERNILLKGRQSGDPAVVLPRQDDFGKGACTVDEFLAQLSPEVQSQCEEAIKKFRQSKL